MSLVIEVQKKPEIENNIKINSSSDVINLKEIKEIRNATQEYLFFIGLDKGNNLKIIYLMGIGTSSGIDIDIKDIIRTALTTYTDRVIFVHNHPSNSLKPSITDKRTTNILNKLLSVFNIQLLDHIIVTKDEFVSMKQTKIIEENYTNKDIDLLDKIILMEENKRLKQELYDFNIKKSETEIQDEEEEEIE